MDLLPFDRLMVNIEIAKKLRDIAFTNFPEKLKYFEIFQDVKF